jgi:hypothetical protein
MCVMTLTTTAAFEETAPGRLGSTRVSIRRRILSGLLGRMASDAHPTSGPLPGSAGIPAGSEARLHPGITPGDGIRSLQTHIFLSN